MPTSYTEIEKYDRAVYEYLTSVSDKVIYAPTDIAVKNITKREQFDDQKPWSFISFHRDPRFGVNWEAMNNFATITGDLVRVQGDPTKVERVARYVQNIPVDLEYHVELWSSKSQGVQELAIALISKLYMEDQVLKAPINPDGEDARFHILDISWVDNSDIERESDIGRIYRHSIGFTIDARITLVRDVATTRYSCIPVNIYDEYEGEL